MAGTPVTRIGPPQEGDRRLQLVIEFKFPVWNNPPRGLIGSGSENVGTRQVTVTAEGGLIPVTLGRDRLGARIVDVVVYANKLIIMAVWGVGPYDGIESVYLGSEVFTGTARHYLGANVEANDPTLVLARPGFTNPTGIAFSVIEVATTYESDSLAVTGTVRGRNDIFDQRLNGGAGADAYTTNAALATGWYIDNVLGETVDQTDLETCADYCDQALDTLIGDFISDRGALRHTIGMTFSRGIRKDRALLIFQEYAKCYLGRDGGTVRMTPDNDAASALTVTPNDIIKNSNSKQIDGLSRVPNMLTVSYTDTNDPAEWNQATYTTPIPSGGVPIREQRVSLDGIQSLSQAKRYGTERLNKYLLERMTGAFNCRENIGLRVLPGTLLDLTDTEGATLKKVRVLDVNGSKTKGQWRVDWKKHDPAVYSDSIETEPSVRDTTLPNPNAVPTPTALVLTVAAPQFQTGIYLSSIRATWDELADYPFDRSFEIVLKEAGETEIIGSRITTELEVNVGPLSEGLTYDVEVRAIGVFGTKSAAVTGAIAVAGKDFPPTDVPNFVALGVGGEIRTRWDASADNTAIWRYEIRYGASGVTWAAAIFVARLDSLAYTITEVPPGTWDILIKAIDNAFNESATETRASGVIVDNDANAFILGQVDAAHASNVSMTALYNGDYIVDSGETWDSLFPLVMDTYTNPIHSYQTPGFASYISGELDPAVGAVTGTWQGQTEINILTGAPLEELQTFDGSVWSSQGQLSIVAEAEKSRYKASGTGSVFLITPPSALRLDVVARTVRGFSATLASGGDRITFTDAFSSIESIVATPEGTSANISIVYDIDNTAPFDWVEFYAFDNGNSQVINGYSYIIRGI